MKTNNWLCTKFVAHRGLFNNKDLPENSLPAFEAAVQSNFAIELDVQITKDGVLVVFHDDTLLRMTGVPGLLEDKTYVEIKNLKLIGTNCTIPTFDQFLELIDGRTQLIIELKSHKKIGEMEQKVYERLKTYKGEYVIESFNPFIVRWFKVNAPEIMRGQLSDSHKGAKIPAWQKFVLKNLLLCKWNGSQFIAYNVECLAENKAVFRWRKRVPVIVYTVRSQKQYDETKHMYENMIFDSYLPERTDLLQQ